MQFQLTILQKCISEWVIIYTYKTFMYMCSIACGLGSNTHFDRKE